MQKLISLKQGVSVSFRKHPVLTALSVVGSMYIFSLIALAMVLTISPESKIGTIVESLF